jgi:hypothetical protein
MKAFVIATETLNDEAMFAESAASSSCVAVI